MKIYTEQPLSSFEFWGGAKDTVKYLTATDFDIVEFVLEVLYPEGMDDTTINDIFWFEQDSIAEALGYSDWTDLVEVRK